jgi:hypothetical protein
MACFAASIASLVVSFASSIACWVDFWAGCVCVSSSENAAIGRSARTQKIDTKPTLLVIILIYSFEVEKT